MNLTDKITEQAKTRAKSIAIYYDEGSLTYEELDVLIWKIANKLNKSGVKRGDMLALLFADELMLLLSILAVARLGATVFSVPAATPTLLANAMLNKAKASYILTDLDKKYELENIFIKRTLLSKEIEPVSEYIKDDNPTYPWWVMSGSGTTGNSKLIPITHKQFMHRMDLYDELFEISVDDRISSLIHLCFSTAKQQLLHALLNGAAVVLFDKPLINNIEKILEKKISVVYTAVIHLEYIIKHLSSDTKDVFSSLKFLGTSGSTVTQDLRERVWKKLSHNLCIMYGTNECGIITIVKKESNLNIEKSVGQACCGTEFEVLDKKGNRLSCGEVGQVRMRGLGMSDHYLHNKEATNKAYRDGWFYPGDLGAISENGELLYWGREDHLMIMDGINIYPAEIESVMTQHPSVMDTAVMPIKHQVHQDIPVCAVALSGECYSKELMEFAYERVGSSGPREMLIVDKIPRNAQGKLIRQELQEIIVEKLRVKRVQSQETILVMFSGGVDSTFMLYHYLKNTDYKVHVHHISLRYPSEPRWQEEDFSSRKIVEYCKKIRSFEYSESRFETGFYKYAGRDSDTQLLLASKVAPNLSGRVSVALGWQYRIERNETFAGRMDNKVSEKLWLAFCASMDGRLSKNVNKELLFPLITLEMTKQKIVQTLPSDLLNLTWSCRHPVKQKNGLSKACGKCRACKQFKEACQ